MGGLYWKRLSCRAACAVLCWVTAAATARDARASTEIPNPSPAVGDLFGISVAVVGGGKIPLVLIGAPGDDSQGLNAGAAYLFDVDGIPFGTFFSPNPVAGEFFGTFVSDDDLGRVLVTATQTPDKQGPPTLPGKVYLLDLGGRPIQVFTNPNPTAGDLFGVTAYLGNDLVVIGSPGDDVDGADAGRVFLFQIGNPLPTMVFSDPTPDAGGFFGFPIAVLGPTRFVAGAPGGNGGAGEFHVFDINDGLVTTIQHPDNSFELVSSVAALGPDKVLVGSEDAPVNGIRGAGSVFIFDAGNGDLLQTINNPAPANDDAFGIHVAALGTGRFAVAADLDNPAGIRDAGRVYLFHASGLPLGTIENPTPESGDQFGLGLAAIGCDGLVVGAPQGEDIFTPVGPGEAHVFTVLPGGCEPDFINLTLVRADDFSNPKDEFFASMSVSIPDVAGVDGVTVTPGNGIPFPLELGFGGEWFAHTPFPDLAAAKAVIDGTWTIAISGAAPSTSTFTFNAGPLQDSDFFPTPTNVTPDNGSIVLPEVAFSWDDPTGPQTPYALSVVVENGTPEGEQTDDSVFGTLNIKDTTWDPPLDLSLGNNRFTVRYVDFDDAALVGNLKVMSGAIAWGDSPYAPPGYPSSTPLLILGSQTRVAFEVEAATIGFDPPAEFPAAGQPNIHAVGDLDLDGDIDVAVAIPGSDPKVPGSVQVFRNLGVDQKGTWLGLAPDPTTIPVGREPSGIAIGPFNGGLLLDIAVCNAGDNNVSILINQGNATFNPVTPVPVGNRPSAVAAGDFTEDSLTDLAVTNEDDNNVEILVGDGKGGFSASGGEVPFGVGLNPIAMSSGDFDNNKCPDLVGGSRGAGAGSGAGTVFVALGLGQGSGKFAVTLYPVGNNPRDVASADLDRDGFNDIAAVNTDDGTVALLINQGNGTFVPGPLLTVGAQPRSIEAVDLDLDSQPDLAIAADDPKIGPAVQTLENIGGAGHVVFAAPVAFGVDADPKFLVSADFDGDGAPDLVTVNSDTGQSGGSVTVLLGNPVPPTLCPGDVDGDGDVGMADFMDLIGAWGDCPPQGGCPADFDGDGTVGIVDFLTLLEGWGPC